jgi:hypothetical protein
MAFYKKKRKKLNTKAEIKIGDLVKPGWASAAQKKDKSWNIPPLGIVMNIAWREKAQSYVANIDWQKSSVPEVNAATDDHDLARYNKYYNEISVNILIPYEPYIKSFTARNKKKLYKK